MVNLRDLRVAKGWTQAQVARKLGVGIPAYSNIESGQMDLKLSRVYELAGVFEVSVTYLLGERIDNQELIDELNTVKNKYITLLERNQRVSSRNKDEDDIGYVAPV